MNKKIILIDTIPITLKSTEINDYISKCILTYLHEPMFYQINGQYFSKYIRDYISSNFLIFEICDFFCQMVKKCLYKIFTTLSCLF